MYKFLRSVIFLLAPEVMHNITIRLLRSPVFTFFLRIFCQPAKFNRETRVFGLNFKNKVGLAAGYDKNGEAIKGLAALGFGFIEVGTVTPKPQPGNPKPRIFRLPADQAIINRMGFNNAGVQSLKQNIEQTKLDGLVLGINIGKNKSTPLDKAVDDYVYSFRELYDYAGYFVVNVSSPNTPGLRELQDKDYLDGILGALQKENRELGGEKPVFVKIAPDLTFEQIDDVISLVDKHGITGIVATNTTISRENLRTKNPKARETGGLSGRPLADKSTGIIRYIRKKAPNIVIIGVGGIMDEQGAIEKLEAGADLIQIYTGMIYNGPCLVRRIKKALLHRDKENIQK